MTGQAVKTIYLDSNIHHYFVRGFPDEQRGHADRAALETCLRSPHLRFVLSDWNLTEAAREKDPRLTAKELLARYSDFFLQLKPLYLPTPVEIERMEMQRCVCRLMGWSHDEEIPVFNETFTQLLAITRITPMPLDYDLRHFMTHLQRNAPSRDRFRQAEQAVPSAMRTWQRAHVEGLDKDPTVRARIEAKWFEALVLERRPDGCFIARQQRAEIVERLARSPSQVYDACPAIHAESVLAEVRARFVAREPARQDAMDLMHAVPPVAYCTAFVSNDGHLRECLKQAAKHLASSLIIVKSLAEAVARIGALESTKVTGERSKER